MQNKMTRDKRRVKRVSGTMGDLSDVRASGALNERGTLGGGALSSVGSGRYQRWEHKTTRDKRP
jgi:hypothetical protein